MTDEPERLVHPIVAEIEAARQQQQLLAGAALLQLMYDLITYQPPKREHWWQVWRRR